MPLGVEPDEVTTVRAFVEGRELDAFLVPALAVPLRLDIAIAWPDRITPRFDYGGVARDRYLALAVLHAARVGVLAADELAPRLARARGLEAGALRHVLCAAIGTAVVAGGRLGLEGVEAVPIAQCRHLVGARCWPSPEPETWLSLRELADGAQRIGTFHFARPGASGVTVDGRTVVVASAEELSWLTAALRPRAAPVPYDRGVLDERGLVAIERDRPSRLLEALATPVTGDAPAPALGPRLRFERKGQRGVIAVSGRPQIARLHLGATLSCTAYTPRFGPVAIAIDEEAAVPTAGWDGVTWPGYPSGVLEAERELCAAVVAAVEGNAEGAAGLEGFTPGAPPRRYLLEAAGRLKQRLGYAKQPAPADVELLARIEALPILEVLDERGEPAPASLAAVAAAHPAPSLVPVLPAAPGFATLGWRPVVLPESDFTALGSCLGGRARHAHLELPERERAARLEQARRAFFARPEEDPAVLGPPADPGVAPVHLTSEGGAPVTVTTGLAAPGSPGAIQALYLRRPLAVLAPERALPMVARVGLVSVEHVRDWTELTDAGRAEVALRGREGALALATALIGRHGSGVLREPRAFALIVALLEDRDAGQRGDAAAGPAASLALAVRGSVRWPTVQGGEATLAELRTSDGEIYAGPRRFLVWRGPTRGRSELDTPILHLPEGPEGDRLRPLLSALGLSVRDVGAALEKLQARRGAAGSQDAPRLAGEPAHPALRWSLETLDLLGVEGEVEIVAGPGSEVTLVELDGPRKVDVGLPVPMRIVARTEGVRTEPTEAKELLKKVTRAAVRQMRELAGRLDELPPFVRDHLRALACTAVSRQQRAARAIERAPLFPDTAGAHASLEELRADPTAQWAFTTSPPPYPARSYGHRVLRLSADEAKLLAAGLQTKNVTSLLHQDLVGEVRAAATPLERVELADERRAECVCVSPMTGRIHGEIGLLAPAHATSRGIALHVGRRPLDLLDDGRGWPIAAAINADHLKPNRWFNGLVLSSEGAEVSGDVRAAADAALRAWIQAPADALEVRYLGTRDTSSAGGVFLCGAVWLPALCPRVPRVMIRHGAGVAPGERVAAIAAPPAYLRGHVPIAGELLVVPERGGAMTDDGWAEVAESLRRRAAEMIEAVAARQAAPPSIVAAYLWSLRLVGAEPDVPLEAPLAAGGVVAPDAILAELARTGALWWSARRGTSEGNFPGEAPAFVLLGEGPAFETLRVRLAPEALRELGGDAAGERGDAAPATVASAPEGIGSTPEAPAASDEAAEAAARAANALRAAGRSTSGEPEQPSWLAGLVRKAVAIVRPPVVEAPEGDALARALLGAIADLGLPGAPVDSIAYTHRGRPLRFDPKHRRLVVRRGDARVGALFERAPTDARALAILAAAAVGEINRSLEGISDAEERRALQHLLARAAQ